MCGGLGLQLGEIASLTLALELLSPAIYPGLAFGEEAIDVSRSTWRPS